MIRLSSGLAVMITFTALVACSSSAAPDTPLSVVGTYHLRSIDGMQLPISDPGGGFIDSGHVRRLGGDTVWVDQYGHTPPSGGLPGTQTIAHGTWRAAQSGNAVILYPLAASEVDTAFLGRGDSLTLHTSSHIQLYVAP